MDVKISSPLLPLRDIVVFPSMVIPLFVGRDKSISALNEVMKNDKKIILVTQKNYEIDDPKKTDIFMYGCEGNILQLLKKLAHEVYDRFLKIYYLKLCMICRVKKILKRLLLTHLQLKDLRSQY